MNETQLQTENRPTIDLNDKIRVLLVDDDQAILKVAKQCLEIEAPLQVDTSISAQDALKQLSTEKYEVIISDYQMPVKDGLEFLKELRTKDSQIPFIMFTGKGREEVAIKALNLGATQYLNKHGETQTVYAELAHSITELAKTRKAEQKQNESEEKFRTLFEKANDGLVYVDTTGKIIDANQKALQMAQKNREDIIGKSFLDLGIVNPKNIPDLLDKLKQQITGKPIEKFQFEIQNQNSQKTLVEINSTLIQKNNTPAGCLAIVTDVTERKKAQEALKESEERYSRLSDAAFEGIGISEQGKIVDANHQLSKMLGYEPGELMGKTVLDFVAPESRDLVTEKMRSECEDPYEHLALKKDGSIFPVEIRARVIHYKGHAARVTVIRDITDRKQAEQALKLSEQTYKNLTDELQRFSTAIKTSVDGVVIADAEGRIIEANDAALKLYGANDKKDLIGKNSLDLVAPEERQKLAHNMKETASKGCTGAKEIIALNMRGERIPVESTTTLIKDAEGKSASFLGIVRDLTDRKSQQRLLEESQQKFAALFLGNPEATAYLDPDFRILDVNPRFETLFGYSPEETAGKHLFDLIVPENLLEEAKALKEKSAVGYVYHDTLRKRKDGSLITVSVSAAPIRVHDKLIGYVWLYKDISRQKAAEDSLKESEERFRALFTGSPEASVYLTPDFRIADINRRFEEVFGYSLPEIMGKRLDEVIVQETKKEEAGMLNDKALGGYVYHQTERRRRDGSLVPVSISAAPIVIKGQFSGTIGTYKDISDLKSAQQKLGITNEKLRVVGSLTRHDIRNKLTILTGNAYLMKKKLKDHPDLLDYLEEMDFASSAILKLLEFAKDYERLGDEELTYVDLKDSIQKAVSLFMNIDQTKIMNQCNGLTVLADSLLSKLFYNLIDNSLKHGGRVTRIDINCEETEHELKLVYEDDGVGISQEAKPRLFSEGYTTGNGSGYGLYLIKKIIEAYSWSVHEAGLPGKGARFVIHIPKLNQQIKENYHRCEPPQLTSG